MMWHQLNDQLEILFERNGISTNSPAVINMEEVKRQLAYAFDRTRSEAEVQNCSLSLCEWLAYFEPFEQDPFERDTPSRSDLSSVPAVRLFFTRMDSVMMVPSSSILRWGIQGAAVGWLKMALCTWVHVQRALDGLKRQDIDFCLSFLLMESVVFGQRECLEHLLGRIWGVSDRTSSSTHGGQHTQLLKDGVPKGILAHWMKYGLLDALVHLCPEESRPSLSQLLISRGALLSERTYRQLIAERPPEGFAEGDYRSSILEWARADENRYTLVPEDLIVNAAHLLLATPFRVLLENGFEYSDFLLNRVLAATGKRGDGHELVLELLKCARNASDRPIVIGASSFECVMQRNLPASMVEVLTSGPYQLPSPEWIEGELSGHRFLRQGAIAVLKKWPDRPVLTEGPVDSDRPLSRALFFKALWVDVSGFMARAAGQERVLDGLLTLFRATSDTPLTDDEMQMLQIKVQELEDADLYPDRGGDFTALVYEALNNGAEPQPGIEELFRTDRLTLAVDYVPNGAPAPQTMEMFLIHTSGWMPTAQQLIRIAERHGRAVFWDLKEYSYDWNGGELDEFARFVCALPPASLLPRDIAAASGLLEEEDLSTDMRIELLRKLVSNVVVPFGFCVNLEEDLLMSTISEIEELDLFDAEERSRADCLTLLLIESELGCSTEVMNRLWELGYTISSEHLVNAICSAEDQTRATTLARLHQFYTESKFVFDVGSSLEIFRALRERLLTSDASDMWVNEARLGGAHIRDIFARMSQCLGEEGVAAVIHQLEEEGRLDGLSRLFPTIFSQQNLDRAH